MADRKIVTVLEPEDEYPHEPDAASNYNESMYLNAFDLDAGGRRLVPPRQPGQRGLRRDDRVRLPARRPGRVRLRPARDRRPTTRWTPAACTSRWSSPFEHLKVTYDGQGLPARRAGPDGRPPHGVQGEPVGRVRGRPRLPGHRHRCTAASRCTRTTAPSSRSTPRRASPRPTTSSTARSTGTITVGEETIDIDGLGLRDKSWGPRYWQAVTGTAGCRWCFGPDFAMMISIVGGDRQPRRRHGARGRRVPPHPRVPHRVRLGRRRLPDRHALLGPHRRRQLRGHGRGHLAHPAAQPAHRPRRRRAAHPHHRGHDPLRLRRPDRHRHERVPRPDRRRQAASAPTSPDPLPRSGDT